MRKFEEKRRETLKVLDENQLAEKRDTSMYDRARAHFKQFLQERQETVEEAAQRMLDVLNKEQDGSISHKGEIEDNWYGEILTEAFDDFTKVAGGFLKIYHQEEMKAVKQAFKDETGEVMKKIVKRVVRKRTINEIEKAPQYPVKLKETISDLRVSIEAIKNDLSCGNQNFIG